MIAVVVIAIVAAVLIPRQSNLPIGRSGYALVKPATFLRSVFNEASTKIRIISNSGQAGEVVLWQDPFDGPSMVIPAVETNVFFCLYDFDTQYLLVRIDLARPFEAIDAQDILNRVLFSATCRVSNASSGDWNQAVAYLKAVTARDFRQQIFSTNLRSRNLRAPQVVLRALEHQGIR